MFKHISKLMNHQPLKVTMLSLMLAITGIVGVSYTGETHQKLLSSTAQANTYHQIPTEELTENITTLSTKSRELNIKGKVQFPDQDGIYLYGQSAQPNQLGEGYILFQKQQNRIIGALYVPQSEFSCFQGTLAKSGELAMTVKSSPGEVGAIEVSTRSRIPQISDDTSETYAHSISLQDYYQLTSVSANDRNILQMCKQEIRYRTNI
ncbi:MAG: hypothetical protein ACKO3K_14245 [Cuspidothrix sp.]